MNVKKFLDLIKDRIQQTKPGSTTAVMTVEAADRQSDNLEKRCASCDRLYPASDMVCSKDGHILVRIKADCRLIQIDEIVLNSRFKITNWIGQGSLTEVYRAVDEQNGEACAVKILRSELGQDAKTVHRFFVEVENNSTLSHPFIAKIFAQGMKASSSGTRPLLAMEWLAGESMAKKIKEEQSIETVRALGICISVCEALEYAHSRGVTHRDLKPSNIFLLTDGAIKITDFGLAERLLRGLDWTKPQGVSVTGSVYGDPSYLDPHFATKGKAAPTCDIYSLGCILHECLTGAPPFSGENEMQVLFSHLQQQPELVSKQRTDLKDCGIDELVLKCLRKEPAMRYQSAQELQAALSSIKSSLKSGN
jgi:eukaryotic-like serine/threonine-protein kinase